MKYLLIVTTCFLAVSFSANAQKIQKIEIQTSAVCEMCQYTIEKDMAFEKGVESATLDLDTKKLLVTFNSKKTSPETIRKRITLIGYDADSLKRDAKAHSKLPYCCQSDENGVPFVDHGDDHKDE
ncbi:heavy-metal-associated domain-containing protein [Marinoscillum furvescens]|uniref:Copper chaperone CopZ n=1 Tax=Marinoscillum furvescens DSM 4134 TaxID=1122208 RepID=A0A3D9LG18_MARFU|nr:heavy-metal-associated domain-containing protein [Marinoscillum furvescens]REE05547.1 copper chaperone CopZ [Marinoscillum furvescens DSM 4134]